METHPSASHCSRARRSEVSASAAVTATRKSGPTRLARPAAWVFVEAWILDRDLVARGEASTKRAGDGRDRPAGDHQVRRVDSVRLEGRAHPLEQFRLDVRSAVTVARGANGGEDPAQVRQEARIRIRHHEIDRTGWR